MTTSERVAVELFGWKDSFRHEWPDGWLWIGENLNDGEVAYIPDFFADREAVFKIVDLLREEGWEFHLRWRPTGSSLASGWSAEFETHVHGGGDVECKSDYPPRKTMAEAIISAALKTTPHRGKKALAK